MALTRVPQEVLKQSIQGGLFTNTFDAIAQTWGTSVVPQTGAFTKLMRGWQGFAVTNYVDVEGHQLPLLPGISTCLFAGLLPRLLHMPPSASR